MLSHRLSGFTGPVPSAALDKSVFSCFRVRYLYHPCVRLSRESRTLFQTSLLKLMQDFPSPYREFPEASVRWGGTLLPQAVGRALVWPVSLARESSRYAFGTLLVALGLLAVQQSSPRGRCPDGPRPEPGTFSMSSTVEMPPAALTLQRPRTPLTISSTSWKLAPAVEKPVLVLM